MGVCVSMLFSLAFITNKLTNTTTSLPQFQSVIQHIKTPEWLYHPSHPHCLIQAMVMLQVVLQPSLGTSDFALPSDTGADSS
jgi:hypothetical protein